jgi:hypothetical protein
MEGPATEAAAEPLGAPSFDSSIEARQLWPYLSADAGYFYGSTMRNGRELGQWIVGHLFGRQMHENAGLRVQVPADMLDGVFGVLGHAGVLALRYSLMQGERGDLVTIDVWTQA